MSWQDDKVIDEFKRLFDSGDYSFGMMARALNSKFHWLNLTRNAVIGKAKRLGWVMPEGKKQAIIEHTKPTVQKKLYSIKSGPAHAQDKPKPKPVPVKKSTSPTPKIEVAANDITETNKPAQTPFKTHTDLLFAWRPNQCRYIYGDYQTDEIIFACEGEQLPREGEETRSSWCEHHVYLNTRKKKVEAKELGISENLASQMALDIAKNDGVEVINAPPLSDGRLF